MWYDLATVSVLAVVVLGCTCAFARESGGPLCISGIYPHLTVYNEPNAGECGIGAIVPWAGRLWLITYPPHAPRGSVDKLYAIAPDLEMAIRPESVGGTPAGRMIHRESRQLLIGPYLIDAEGRVRVIPPSVMPGRLTAISRHLSDPANKVYYFDMEGAIYEANVHTLEVTRLFAKPVPGWHGKGGYTAQGRYVIANNGEVGGAYKHLKVGGPAKNDDEMGVLAEWDGREWRIIERRQFCDVTGPGGIHGSPDDEAPLWSIGWDRRGVILKLLDAGTWYTYRLPKASHAYDHRGGWYTEWPRIRSVGGDTLMMDMHGMFYEFPKTFCRATADGLRPMASHLRYVPDFCEWRGRVVLASDDTTIMQNPMAGQSQSNLWFGTLSQIRAFGPRSGWGGVWQNDPVEAGAPSDPFLFAGFDRRVLHLSHDADVDVRFDVELDVRGTGTWYTCERVVVPPKSYRYYVFPDDVKGEWVRVTASAACAATAYFHVSSRGHDASASAELFAGLADVGDDEVTGGIIRPAKHNKSLQYVVLAEKHTPGAEHRYVEVDETMRFASPGESRVEEVIGVAGRKKDFEVDEASVIMEYKGRRYRLPKGDAAYGGGFVNGFPRGIREVCSERYLMNIHGTFYEMPREAGLPRIRPVASHRKQIMDYCTWRGLLVISGVREGAGGDGHVFASSDGNDALWFGAVDDLWKLGRPVGVGGPWKEARVKAGAPSDPYLMTNYTDKRVALSHDAVEAVAFTIEVDVDHTGWHAYRTIDVPAGRTVEHRFPDGYSAHWARLVADRDCAATAVFTYE